MWLSGMRNEPATGARTPIWCRTRVRSGVVAGSISHTISNGRCAITRTLRVGRPVATVRSRPYCRTMASRPLRFGVSMGKEPSGSTWLDAARRAEALGFDTLFIADHLVGGLHSPFSASGFALAATDRLKVGTLVINNDFRHPLITAHEAATLSDLSGGRFELGLGAGHMKSEYDEAGLVFDRAGTRVARMTEAAEIARGLLTGDE